MKIQLGVFFGGRSVEHEVSVITALQAIEAIDKTKYTVIPIYMTKTGDFYTGDKVGQITEYDNIPELLKNSTRIILVRDAEKVHMMRYPAKKFGDNRMGILDIAFPMGHGTNVEDGVLQGYLQTLGLPYVGCDVTSAAVGMDKYIMKAILSQHDVPVLRGVRVRISALIRDRDACAASLEQEIGYPMMIKPINLGSSVGIRVAKNKDALYDSLEHAFLFCNEIIAEKAIRSLREINVSVLGDSDDAEASECEEPFASDEILSYENKYLSGGKGGKSGNKSGASGTKGAGMASLSRKIAPDISPAMREQIRSYAVRAFQALRCCGVARIDFLLDTETEAVYFNEINTLPGSLAYYLWEPVGVSYPVLLDKMIALAQKREREKSAVHFSFDTNLLSAYKNGFGGKGSKGSKQ